MKKQKQMGLPKKLMSMQRTTRMKLTMIQSLSILLIQISRKSLSKLNCNLWLCPIIWMLWMALSKMESQMMMRTNLPLKILCPWILKWSKNVLKPGKKEKMPKINKQKLIKWAKVKPFRTQLNRMSQKNTKDTHYLYSLMTIAWEFL